MLIEVNLTKLALEAIEYSSKKEGYTDYIVQLLEKSLEYWYGNYFDEALKLCDEFIQMEPDLLVGRLQKALIYTSKKDYHNSNSIIEDISEMKMDSNEEELKYFIQSCNSFYIKEYVDSIKFCNKTLSIDKSNGRANLIRAMAFAELNDHRSAILDYKKALKEKWKINEIKVNLAYSYLRNKDNLKALLVYRRYAHYFPNNWKVQYNAGLSYFRFKFFSKALVYLNKTEKLNPNFVGTYITRGYIYLKKGQRQLTLADWNRARDLGDVKKVDYLMKKYYNKFKI